MPSVKMSYSKTMKRLSIFLSVCVGQTPFSYYREIKVFVIEESCSYSLAKTSQTLFELEPLK